ncbi:MAG: hypothetical protein KDB88_03340, partial [Flavobacteriales bacterium]|nr:hypothetical protein [Flavobacteriales bacterium]
LLLPQLLVACTAFVVHQDGRTFVGNNEDSWCIEAKLRFVPGGDDLLGAVYFSTWRGHPYLPWGDQIGMNEVGLVFDGLVIQPKAVAPASGKDRTDFGALSKQLMERCHDVPEAVAFLHDQDLTFLYKSMLFLADAAGNYAVVQNDTIITGQGPHFALGNWRLNGATDHASIPIPRLQQGRELLKAGVAPTLDGAWSVLESMGSCREFLDNGTFFSTLFEPDRGRVHLAFYHDYDRRISFDLEEELAKGEHTLDLPSLFPPNEAFQRLENYLTPFHQRWLFWGLMGWAGLAVIWGFALGVVVILNGVQRLRNKALRPSWPLIVSGIGMVALVALVGVLLSLEQVFYFGLGDVHPALVALPYLLLATALIAGWHIYDQRVTRWSAVPTLLLLLPMLVCCAYWGLFTW